MQKLKLIWFLEVLSSILGLGSAEIFTSLAERYIKNEELINSEEFPRNESYHSVFLGGNQNAIYT